MTAAGDGSAVARSAREVTGVIASTWSMDAPHAFAIRSVTFGAGNTGAIMRLLSNLGFVLMVGIFAMTIHRTSYNATRKLHVQAWHLKQLLPAA